MARKYSKAQNAYMVAKAHYETIRDMFSERVENEGINELYDVDFDEAFDKEEKINEELGYDAAYQMLSKAGTALVEWSFEKVRNHPLFKKNLKDMEYLYERYQKDLTVKDKLINLAMKLDAAK